jgi:hypothetical protein
MSTLASDAIELTSFGSSINLMTHAVNVQQKDIEELEIVAATTGASIVCRTKGSGTTDRTYNVAQGTKLTLPIREIRSVTNVTNIRVSW